MLTQYLIQRIQDDWAKVVQQGGQVYFIPKNWLPAAAIEGDEIFILPFRSRENPDKGKQLNIVLAPRKVFKDAKVVVYKSIHTLSDAA